MNIRAKAEVLVGEVLRFAITGGFNTLVTIALYQLMVSFVSSPLAYTISWVIGFAIVAVAYPKYVFKSSNNSFQDAATLLVLYLCSFLLGYFFVSWLKGYGVEKRLSIIFVVALTSIFNFLAAKILYSGRIIDKDKV